jgi:hypothetical protein
MATQQQLWIEKVNTELLPALKKWLDYPPPNKDRFSVLYGPVGAGKTWTVTAAGVQSQSFFSVMESWRENPWSPAAYPWGVVCLDEVKEISIGPFGLKALDVLENIVDEVERVNHLRLIITTNLTLPKFREYVGERAFDRLSGHGVFIPFNGPSLRGHEPTKEPLKMDEETAAKLAPVKLEKAWEIIARVAQGGGQFRKLRAAEAFMKSVRREKPFHQLQEFWPEWMVNFVAEGKALAESGFRGRDSDFSRGISAALKQIELNETGGF